MLLREGLWGLLAATTVSAALVDLEIMARSSSDPGIANNLPRNKDLFDLGGNRNLVVCGVDNSRDRSKWTRPEYDIHTDYEDLDKIPKGVVRKYNLTITNEVIAPDGYLTEKMVVNGQYPGPMIEGCWGDVFEITVHNKLTNGNGTAMHWHGVQQLGTNHMDGAAGVSQCPIPPGGSMTYRWRANQYGTSWYHSHFSLQYTDGVVGPIVIHGPTSANYDEEYLLMLTDWYHHGGVSNMYREVFVDIAPEPESWLLNGKWQYPCNPKTDPRCIPKKGGRHEITFQKGKKYKIRVVNMSTTIRLYSFWLQGHDFTVVQSDFVPITPFKARSLDIAVAQRYDVIVEANADTREQKDFWINMRSCNDTCAAGNGTGIIRYDPHSTRNPPTSTNCDGITLTCLDTPKESLSPILKMDVPAPPPDLLTELYPSFNSWPNASVNLSLSVGRKWSLGNETFVIDWTQPTYSYLGLEKLSSNYRRRDKAPSPDSASHLGPMPSSYQPIYLKTPGQWAYLVINANWTTTDPAKAVALIVGHPIHLHGHDFFILAQVSKKQFNPNTPPAFNLKNPARRDTASIPHDGYLVIAFQAKNPGWDRGWEDNPVLQNIASLAADRKVSGNIARNQPRRLEATVAAERVAKEAGCELGASVGYQIRGDDRTSKKARLQDDVSLLRSAVVNRAAANTRKLKVVVMSATSSARRFIEYFTGKVKVAARDIPG
ncbi:Laccase-2 [Drechslerella dactyloides]|uniref:Laccase-2 n=1 Tax=Drechslerella dactyloides TaxID=74499 RepID=A0AAD6IPX2_DREDA|nr:Laccase-2 [Drechslerella dactyloides]